MSQIIIIAVILIQIFHFICNIEPYDILYSDGDIPKATQLNDKNTLIIFQIESKAHYMIISYLNGEILKDITLLNPKAPITYQDKANVQTFNDDLIIIADINNAYLFNYKTNEITSEIVHSSEGTSLPIISLSIDKVNKKFVIANRIDSEATINLYDIDNSSIFPNPKTETLSQDITYFECNIYPNDPYRIICFYLTSGSPPVLYYLIYDNNLENPTEAKTTDNIKFTQNYSKGFHTFFFGTNKDIAICGFEQDNSSNYIFTSCRMAKLKDDLTLEKTVPKGQNYSPVAPCEDEYHNIHYASIDENKFAGICINQQNTTDVIYSIVELGGEEGLSFSNDSFSNKLDKKTYNTNSEIQYTEISIFINETIGLLYQKNDEICIHYIQYANCEDYIIDSIFPGETIDLDFSSHTIKADLNKNNDIQIKIIPHDKYNPSKKSVIIKNNDSIITDNNTIAPISNQFKLESGNTPGVFTYPFYAVQSGYYFKECKLIVNVNTCYYGCLKCNNYGENDNNMKCTSCDNDNGFYRKKSDTASTEFNCYNEHSIGNGFYVEGNEWTECNVACNKCTEFGEPTNTQCVEGKCNINEDYYPVKDNPTQCYLKTESINKLFFDSINLYWDNCDEGCLTCTQKGKCLTCDTNYYFYEEDKPLMVKCYKETNFTNTNVFLDENQNPKIFSKCHEACKTCNEKGTSFDDTKCLECDTDNGYYSVEGNSTQCYKRDFYLQGYYADHSSSTFIQCHSACLTCGEKGSDDNDTKCIACNNGYYPLIDKRSQCYTQSEVINYYYFNSTTNQFHKCDKSCQTCSTGPINSYTNCTTCKSEYYKLESDITQCHLPTETIPGYYPDNDSFTFKSCSKACKICTTSSSEDRTNCESDQCADDYAKVIDDPTQCYLITRKDIVKLYYNEQSDQFEKCDVSCKYCNDNNNDEPRCTVCDKENKYYPLETTSEDETTFQCFHKDNKPPPSKTFLYNEQYVYCYESCATCSAKGEENDSKCLSCDKANNYYPLYNDESNCINNEMKENYHKDKYLDNVEEQYKQCGNECKSCSLSEHECDECEDGFHIRIEPPNEETKECLNEDIKNEKYPNYFLDTTDYKYKQCHSNCATCTELGNELNTKCTQCKDEFIQDPITPEHCVKLCEHYYYISLTNNTYQCTNDSSCISDYPYIYETEKKCSHECTLPKVHYEYHCLDYCPEDTIPDEHGECITTDKCKLRESESIILLEDISKSIDEIGKTYALDYIDTDKIVYMYKHISKKYIITLFKSEECASSIAYDLSMLDLANCPELLKQHYGIPHTLPLITLKLDIPRQGQSNQVAYAFYHPQSGERLDLEICANEKVTVKIPITETPGVNVNEALDFMEMGVNVYNISDPFFNDICIPYSVDGKDTTLADRRKHFYQNVSFCEDGCEFKGVDLTTLEADCLCEIKTNFATEVLDNPLTGDLLELFTSFNYAVLNCYKDVFDAKHFVINIGSWIMIGFISAQIAFMIVYIIKGLKDVRNFVNEYAKIEAPPKRANNVGSSSSNNNNNVNEITSGDCNSSVRRIAISQSNSMHKFTEGGENEMNQQHTLQSQHKCITYSNNNTQNVDYVEIPNSLLEKHQQQQQQPQKLVLMVMNHRNMDDTSFSSNASNQMNNSYIFNPKLKLPQQRNILPHKKTVPIQHVHKNIRKVKLKKNLQSANNTINPDAPQSKEEEFSDGELNEMEHYDAMIYDSRSFCQIYWNQLKQKQSFINTFIDIDVLEVFPIKAICFILSVALLFTLNAMLYSEEAISEKFNQKGKHNEFKKLFTDEITRVVYISMISIVIEYIIDCLFSGKRRILTVIKRESDEEKMKEECLDTIHSMKIKNVVFLIVNYMIMLFFWYYISAFCNCYRNTVTSWIISCLLTWAILMLLPFVICLLVAGLRVIGLKCKSEVLYKLSTCLMD